MVHVDCRGLYDPNGSTTHPGIHVGVIEGVVYHRKFDEIVWDFLALLADILWGAETGDLPRCVAPSQGGVSAYITPFCKKGRHRSVAVATLILRWLEAQGAQVTGEHLCKPDWTGCKGRCGECRGEKVGEAQDCHPGWGPSHLEDLEQHVCEGAGALSTFEKCSAAKR